jgi:hypothetical protein
MTQCEKCFATNNNGLWVDGDGPMVDYAEHVTCPNCKSSGSPDEGFSLANAIPKFDIVEGRRVKVEHGKFRGDYIYHFWIKGISVPAFEEALFSFFDKEHVEYIKDLDSYCVTLPIDITPLNEDLYRKEIPEALSIL